jgi:hypothetical protein
VPLNARGEVLLELSPRGYLWQQRSRVASAEQGIVKQGARQLQLLNRQDEIEALRMKKSKSQVPSQDFAR